MGTLRNKATGDTYEVSDSEAVAAARENPDLEIVGSIRVSATDAVREGGTVAADSWKGAAGTGETEGYWHEKHEEAEHDNAASTLKALGGGFVDTATLGLVSPWEEDRKHHEIASGIGTGLGIAGTMLVPGGGAATAGRLGIAGKIAARTPLGAVTRLGARAGSLATRGGTGLARAGVAGVIEGGVQGVGQTVSDVAHMDDLSLENIGASLGSNVFYGGLAGGAAGLAARGIERGLSRAKTALNDIAAKPRLGALGDDTADLANLDKKGLRAAEKAELEAIETGRVAKRAEVADEIKAFRKELKDQKVWLATKGLDDAELKAAGIGKRTLDADRAMDKLLRDPKALAEDPRAALKQLRVQEAALDELVNTHGTRLRETVFAADTSGTRVKALDNAAIALEKNRSLQAKLGELASKPASPRLQAIADATEALNAPKPQPASNMLGDLAAGHVLGGLAGLPGLGTAVAVGRVAVPLVKKLVAGSAENAARSAKAVGAFLDVARKAERSAPVVASKVLGSVRYSQAQEEKRAAKAKGRKAKAPTLPEAFRARADEIRKSVEPTPDGNVQMRMDVRQQIASRLSPIRAANPIMADRLEAIAAKRIEFLASKLPRKPDLPGMSLGPDTWQPSDMEMRAFARYVAAAEDPHGVVERLADGSVTPEDAETMKTVYPEMYADIQRQIMMQLGELRAKLPYNRRLALSIFSGVPVDPALDPRVLAALQGTYAQEPGTEGGIQAPRAEPAFGSISKPQGTPSERRQAGEL
jgi:hypothetical protein